MSGERCLVLGGSGFMGRHLSNALVHAGFRVRVFDRAPLRGDGVEADPGIEHVDGNFADAGQLRAAVDGCAYVFHLISSTIPATSNLDPAKDVSENVVGTLRMLDIAVAAGVRKIVFASSGGTVYGIPRSIPIPEHHAKDPICSYGVSKLAIEKYLEMYRYLNGLDYGILRIANPFGEGQNPRAAQGVIAAFIERALADEAVEVWGDGGVVRDYVYVNDVVGAFLKVLEHGGRHRVFNIGSGIGRSVNEILDEIAAVTGRPIRKNYSPTRKLDVPTNVLDVALAGRELGWKPQTPFTTALKRTAEWYRGRARRR